MRIVSTPITLDELRRMAAEQFGDVVKAVAAELIEFDSMINVRPSQGNRSRGVEDAERQRLIRGIVGRLVLP